jgi:hypothetical protein
MAVRRIGSMQVRIGVDKALAPWAAALLLWVAVAAGPASAQPSVHDHALATTTTIGFETVHLPARERMGLIGASLLFDVADGWWLGPAAYGAATGERGGLFVGGVEVQRRWRFAREQLVAGFTAGGGGGAAAPVGGGLMLRPALAWLHDFGAVQAGLSLSSVRFPTGNISSRQVGVLMAWDGRFRYAEPVHVGESSSDAWRSGLGVDRFAGTLSSYSLQGGDRRRIGLAGARLESDSAASFGGSWHWGFDAAAANQGGAAGYMEVLGSLGWDAPLAAGGAWRAGVRGGVGLGGGGAVPTGSGLVGRLSIGTTLQLAPSWRSGIEIGRWRAGNGALRARTLQWWLALDTEPPVGIDGTRQGRFARTTWSAALQRYSKVQRSDGSVQGLQTIGLAMDRELNAPLYATLQAHSALAGGAGGFSIGLIGAGLATPARQHQWQFGSEVLAGAAGGGGVASAGGAVLQALAWAARASGANTQWRFGVGTLRSTAAGLSSPLLTVQVSHTFAQAGP